MTDATCTGIVAAPLDDVLDEPDIDIPDVSDDVLDEPAEPDALDDVFDDPQPATATTSVVAIRAA